MRSLFKMVHSIEGSAHWGFVVCEGSLNGDGLVRSKDGTGTGLREHTYQFLRHHHLIQWSRAFVSPCDLL